MPHFKTWDDTYYDYHGGVDLGQVAIGVGELQTDVARRAANYLPDPDAVQYSS